MTPPRMAVVRFLANANATMPTPIAPPITNISDGSHKPAISKKANTLFGLDMPAKMRPRPKIIPELKAKRMCRRGFFILGTQYMAHDVDRYHARNHKA